LLANIFYHSPIRINTQLDPRISPFPRHCAIGFIINPPYTIRMASAFSHAIAAVALGKVYTGKKMSWRFWGLAVASTVLPDADSIGFRFGIPYDSMFGHRGITHSLTFALAWAFLVVACEFRHIARFSRQWWGLVVFFFVVTTSHGVLDAFTNGGRGVAFFAPFSSARYFFPWHGIAVSPISVKQFFTHWGGEVLRSEAKYIWLPCSLLWLAAWLVRKLFRHTAASSSSVQSG
jgi:inner membrane protein